MPVSGWHFHILAARILFFPLVCPLLALIMKKPNLARLLIFVRFGVEKKYL